MRMLLHMRTENLQYLNLNHKKKVNNKIFNTTTLVWGLIGLIIFGFGLVVLKKSKQDK